MTLASYHSRQVALATVGYLVGGIIVAIAAGSAIDALVTRHWFIGGRILAGMGTLALFFSGARMWGRRVSEIAAVGDPQRTGWWTGLLVGIPLIAAGGGLAPLEPIAVRIANGWGLPIHAAYLGLFVPAAFIVTAVGSYGLGRGLRDNGLGLRLASGAAPVAAVAFLVGASLMYLIGWRIGEPGAGRRATMLVVTAISVTAAAIAAGWAIGTRLEKRPSDDGDYHLLSFDQTVEASAFMAALSRFMASPAGNTRWPDMHTYEVWSRSVRDSVEIFLSDGAFAMAKEAFSPMPTTKTVRGKEIPRGVMLSLSSFGVVPMGVEEMSQRLQQST